MRIEDLQEADRPREKMLHQGASALTDAELLAILLGSGTAECSAIELAQQILFDQQQNLHSLSQLSPSQLVRRYRGVGPAKAVSICAALELGRRQKTQAGARYPKITSSRDAYDLKGVELANLQHEEMWVLLMDQRNQVRGMECVGRGTATNVLCDMQAVMRSALLQHAQHILMMHNHPSGGISPSQPDRELTRQVAMACRDMNMRLTDHLVVGPNRYYSFADEEEL